MTEPNRIDPERLAALIDGKLGEAEAAAVRRELAFADDDTLAAFADAAAVTAEMEAAAPVASTGVLPMKPTQRSRWRVPATWVGIAAAAAIGIIIFRPSKPPYQPRLFVDAIPAGATASDVVWGGMRGARDGLSDRARAIRVGALLTDVDLDVRNGNSPADHARMLANLLEGAIGATGSAAAWRSVAADANSRPSRVQIADLGRSSIAAVDKDLATAGAYLEAARIAGATGDTDFFIVVSDGPLETIENHTTLDATARQAIKSLRLRLDLQPSASSILGQAARELLRSLAD